MAKTAFGRSLVFGLDDEPEQIALFEGALTAVLKDERNEGVISGSVTAQLVDLKEAVETLIVNFPQKVESRKYNELPDLVVLDWKLRGDEHPSFPELKSGMDIFLRLAPLLLRDPHVRTRFVIVTGYLRDDEKEAEKLLGTNYDSRLESAFNCDLFDFWRKPISPDAIRSDLETMFQLPSRWKSTTTIDSWKKAMLVARNSLSQHLTSKVENLPKSSDRNNEQNIDERNRNLRLAEHKLTTVARGTSLPEFVGRGECFRRTVTQAHQLAHADRRQCVLIQGETGTGKELASRMVHDLEHVAEDDVGGWTLDDRAGLFFDVNCAAFTETTLQSQLFGHIKGAFTDAKSDRPGLFELADGGTVFLDEIGEAGPVFNAMLLRFLETRRVSRLGSEGLGVEVDVRVILATEKDMEAEVREGRVSEAFYRRISNLQIRLDPLRDRKQDIAMLAVSFWKATYSKMFGEEPTKLVDPNDDASFRHALTHGAFMELREFRWPGNIRQLKSVIDTAVAVAGSEGAKPLSRSHIAAALRLSVNESPKGVVQRVAFHKQQVQLEELKAIEAMWSILVPGYSVEDDDAPPGKMNLIKKLASSVIGFDSNFSRGCREREGLILAHPTVLPLLHSYLTKLP